MSRQFLFLLFLGVLLLNLADGSRRPKKQRDVREDSCEDEEDVDARRHPKAGAARPKGSRKSAIQNDAMDDAGDGVEDPTDEDYLRYEDVNQEGICILERGKCPQGDWRMFKRKNETVCLQVFGSPNKIDKITADRVCRQHANSRLMSVDNMQEREWLYTNGLVSNGSYGLLLIAGNRNRQCQQSPLNCMGDKMRMFDNVDGTADKQYLHTRWVGPVNRYTYGYLDNCLTILTSYVVSDNTNAIQDWTCTDWFNSFLCGITVM